MEPSTNAAARLIVADDDDEMRRLVAEALRRDGHRVAEARDGALLLASIAESFDDECEPWDLIVSDVRMPGFSGLDLLAALRASESQTPVILMTAFPDQLTRVKAEHLGATLIGKPFDVKDLRTAVIRLLRHHDDSPLVANAQVDVEDAGDSDP